MPGPPTSAEIRAAGWAEAAILLAAATSGAGTSGAGRGAGPSGAATSPTTASGAGQAGTGSGAGEPTPVVIEAPNGARAEAVVVDGPAGPEIRASVRCGEVLDEVVLRSYCIGAAHMAWSWVTSEALTVDDEGEIHDLTIRSFGVVRAVDTPPIEITIEPDGPDSGSDPGPATPDGPPEPVNGSDAVFVAVAAATWAWHGWGQDWPLG